MPTLLKNLRISFISLVPKGANQRQIILKSADETPPVFTTERVLKTDPAKKRIYSLVYIPNEVDTQGEFTTPEEIEKAAYSFMKELNARNIDVEHSFQPAGAFVAESWLLRKGDALFPDEPEGAWAVGIQIEDDALWGQVEKGEYRAVSMGGLGDKIPGQDPPAGAVGKQREMIVNLVEDAGFISRLVQKLKPLWTENAKETDMDEMQIKKLITKEIETAIDKIRQTLPQPLTKEQMAAVVKEAIKPLGDRIEKVEKASPGSYQGPEDIAKQNVDLAQLGAEIAKMVNGK